MTRQLYPVLLLLTFSAIARAEATTAPSAPASAPATQPLTPQRAVYFSNVDLVNLLLDNPSADDLRIEADQFCHEGDYARAAALNLIALRSKPNDPLIEFSLACDFALWHKAKQGMDFFQKAADHGYWGYRVVTEDSDTKSIATDPAYPAALAKIKASFATEAPKHPPGMTLKTPQGEPPAQGWPVVFLLHGWESSRHDFDAEAAFVTTLGYVGISLDATEVMGPDAYTWTHDSVEPTNDRLQSVLKGLKIKVDVKHVYLHGFSQGAMHAARLLSEYPSLYAGAICNSPGSYFLLPKKLVAPERTGSLVVSVGDADSPITKKSVSVLEKLWDDAKRPVHVIHFDGGHQLPPDPQSMFRTGLDQLSNRK